MQISFICNIHVSYSGGLRHKVVARWQNAISDGRKESGSSRNKIILKFVDWHLAWWHLVAHTPGGVPGISIQCGWGNFCHRVDDIYNLNLLSNKFCLLFICGNWKTLNFKVNCFRAHFPSWALQNIVQRRRRKNCLFDEQKLSTVTGTQDIFSFSFVCLRSLFVVVWNFLLFFGALFLLIFFIALGLFLPPYLAGHPSWAL